MSSKRGVPPSAVAFIRIAMKALESINRRFPAPGCVRDFVCEPSSLVSHPF